MGDSIIAVHANGIPCRAQSATASAAEAVAWAISGFSSSVKRPRTKSTESHWAGGSPIPTRSRGNSSVPSFAMMSKSPLCPPADPPGRNRSLASGEVQVVTHDQQVFVGQRVVVPRGQHALSAEVHVRHRPEKEELLPAQLGLDQFAVELLLRTPGGVPLGQLANHGVADVVPRPLVLASRIAQSHHKLHSVPAHAVVCESRRGSPHVNSAVAYSSSPSSSFLRPITSGSTSPGAAAAASTISTGSTHSTTIVSASPRTTTPGGGSNWPMVIEPFSSR